MRRGCIPAGSGGPSERKRPYANGHAFERLRREDMPSGTVGPWMVASDRGAIGADIRDGIDGVRIDADPDRFRVSPPQATRSLRRANDQGDDLLALYETLLAR